MSPSGPTGLVVKVLAYGLALAVVAAVVLQLTGLYKFTPVLTGSMTPDIPKGALVVSEKVDGKDVRNGDVVLFVPPDPFTPPDGRPVVHRVVSVEPRDGGAVEVRTKGDANPAEDPWTADLTKGETRRSVASVPYVGSVLLFFGSAGGLITLAGLALCVFAVNLLRRSRQPKQD
jgi:signal peptidase I